jgi:hypothetical protein
MKRFSHALILASISAVVAAAQSAPAAAAAESAPASNQPYIDRLKQGLPEEKDSGESYIDSVRSQMKPTSEKDSSEGYTERLRRAYQDEDSKEGTTYLERERAKLKDVETTGAIKAVTEGHSELTAKKSGTIHHGAGFRMGTAVQRDYTVVAGAGNGSKFSDIYGKGWAPELGLFYEFQPFHSEWLGNVGFVFTSGMSYFSGTGHFAYAVNKPTVSGSGGGQFSANSTTKLRFVTIPLGAGVNYRFNLLRYLRPYVQVSPTAIGYLESRSDDKGDHRGFSEGVVYGGGVAILLDKIAPGSSWDLYDTAGVQHFYLTLDYMRMNTINGDVRFASNGLSLGLAYEF